MPPFATIALVLILARAIAELWLSGLNRRHVREHANEVPPAFHGMIDETTYRRSVDYTLAKSRFGDIAGVFDIVVLIALIFSGAAIGVRSSRM
jgi:STE24 endopeptidase